MIIGISGKISSGKDTVGRIIQYLTSVRTYEKSFLEWEAITDSPKYYIGYSKWKVKKFADSLKDIVCILLGCTREQLEDIDFKNKELGEEWGRVWVYDAGWDKQWTAELPSMYPNEKVIKLTPRRIMQLLGTECGRQIIHPNVWINALMSKYKPIKDNLLEGEVRKVREEDLVYPNWIITDVRFPNELKAVEDKDGISIRVNRLADYPASNDLHFSETALDDATFNYTIDNNGTIEELVEKVREILIKEKII